MRRSEAEDKRQEDSALTGKEEGVVRVARRVLLRLEQRIEVPEAGGRWGGGRRAWAGGQAGGLAGRARRELQLGV